VARRAIGEAHDARELRHEDDLLPMGGEFGFSRASQHYLAGSTLLEITGTERDAITELERAAELYEAGPEEGEDHSFELRMLVGWCVGQGLTDDAGAIGVGDQPYICHVPAG
jgi:hypothetical protein